VTTAGWRYFDVAADVGIEAWGPTPAECFRQAALGMFDLMVPLAAVRPVEAREVSAFGEAVDLLLVNWLNELLYLHDVEGFALHDLETPRAHANRIHARLVGEPVDPARHPRGILVKAATLHGLQVLEGPAETRARVILDI